MAAEWATLAQNDFDQSHLTDMSVLESDSRLSDPTI